MTDLTPIEDIAIRLVDLLERRHNTNGQGDYDAIGVYEACIAIKALAQVRDATCPKPEPARPIVHFYQAGAGTTACGINLSVDITTYASRTTCDACAIAKGWKANPAPLVHYTDHHGGIVCTNDYLVPDSVLRTEVRSKVTCQKCAFIKDQQYAR